MDISLKKRVVGILLLLGLGLIIVPLFLGRSAPPDEMQLSGSIPKAPAKPHTLSLGIPDAEETTPAPANAKLQPDQSTPASRLVFEQIQSTPSNARQNTTTSVSTTPAANTPQPPAVSSKPAAAQANKPIAPATSQVSISTTKVSATSPNLATTPTATTTSQQPSVASSTTSPVKSTAAVKNQPKAMSKSSATPVAWVVQLGSFADKINAENLMKKLQTNGFAAYSHIIKSPQGGTLVKVVAGPYLQRNEATNAQLKIQQTFNLKGIVVKTGQP